MQALKTAFTLLAGAVAMTVATAPAHAVSLTVGSQCQQLVGSACSKTAALTASGQTQGLTSNIAGSRVIDFNDAVATNGQYTSGIATYSHLQGNLVDSSVSSQHALPAGDQTRYLTVSNNSNVTGGNGFVDINFSRAIDYFGMYWGSIDGHNEIEFYNGNTLLNRFTGTNIPQAGGGNWYNATDNVYVNFFGNTGETWNRIRLIAKGTAFESDNHAYRQAVPEPLTMGGSAMAMGLVWRLRRKKREAQA